MSTSDRSRTLRDGSGLSSPTERSDMDEHLGTKFWLQLLGIRLAVGIGATLLLWGSSYDHAHGKLRY
jgi:hypothetical protein